VEGRGTDSLIEAGDRGAAFDQYLIHGFIKVAARRGVK
jgi:hypothetical protein